MQLHADVHDALAPISSGDRVFVQGAAATPLVLLDGLVEEASRLENVELIHLHTFGPAHYAERRYAKSFRVANLFLGANMREHFDEDRVDYLPCFLSEIPMLFRSKQRPIDIALIHVSPPDKHGYVTLGTSVDVSRAAVETARVVIAQINRRMPRVHGDALIHVGQIHHAVEIDRPLFEVPPVQPSKAELEIGQIAASLVEDGATLQAGIGAVPDAVLSALGDHRHLGLHTEMFSDGALALLKCGAIDNSKKAVHPGRSVSTFLMGSRELYDFVDDNPSVTLLDAAYVNSPVVIARNPKVVALNSAVEIDLSGQICADSVGHRIISGVGGQMDFMRGAVLSPGGRPILALTSRAKNGAPRIVAALKPGAGVVTTRAHAHFVVTEHGHANLFGSTLKERAKALIALAHPDDREALERAWREQRGSG